MYKVCIYLYSSLEIEIGGPEVQGHSWICIEVLVWLKLYGSLKPTLPDLKEIKGKIKQRGRVGLGY